MDNRVLDIIDRYTKKLAAKTYTLLEATFTDLEQRNASKKVFAKEIYDTLNEMKNELISL